MIQAIKNIFQLGKKEILSLCRDWLLMALILTSPHGSPPYRLLECLHTIAAGFLQNI